MKITLRTQIFTFISAVLAQMIRCNPSRLHCAEPDTLQSLEWTDYSQILQQQSRSLVFGEDFPGHTHAHNITRRHIHHVRNSDETNLNTLCRTKYVSNSDNFRKPEMLMEQTCSREFVFSDGRMYICRPFSIHVSVLRRGPCVRGIWVYGRVWEKLNIGCTAYTVRIIDHDNTPIFADQ